MSAISPSVVQLSAQQLRELADARVAGKYVRRAVAVATFDGWALAVFAIANCACGLADLSSMIIGLALGAMAYVEVRGASQLRRLDETAPRRLGINQILLGTLLAVYAIWHIYKELHGPSPYAVLSQTDAKVGKRFEDMFRSLNVAVYGCLIMFAILAQGGAALYYFTREKYMKAYRKRTPAWILQMQRTGVGV
ncbi:MAG TPA: hypothetical protein VGQ99_02505 [Tepidisphaeraceae bacterium]|jgi:hypothetical protein|nr:hypothetical protein [Tepidisphaeraceae bacterium]